MRVGLICPYDWTAPGGVRTQVAGLAAALGRLGHGVVVITPEGTLHRPDLAGAGGADRPPPSAGAAGAPADGTSQLYRVLRAGRSIRIPANGSIAPVAPTPAAMARTVRALWRFRPDVVHVHEPLVPGPSLAAMLAGPRPIIATFHRAGADRLYAAESRLIGAVMSRAGQSVAVSAAAAATATAALGRHLCRSDLLIVPNGVDLGIYARAREEATRSRSRSLEPTERLTIVFVGRHEDRKGLGVLLEAFTELPPAVRLDVLGDGPRSAELRRRFPDARINWWGSATEADKARLPRLGGPARGPLDRGGVLRSRPSRGDGGRNSSRGIGSAWLPGGGGGGGLPRPTRGPAPARRRPRRFAG